jgi:Flp pilus assembly protein CpaB
MKLRIALVFVAIIIGAIAVFAVITYVSNIRAASETEVEKIEVLVAAQNIPKQTFVENLISAKSVVLQAIPRKYIAEGVLTSLDKYKGYVTAAPINKGQQITAINFLRPEQIGMAFNIPNDMVAISIPIDEIVGVSDLINIGDKVNVIATFLPPTQNTGAQPGQTQTATETTGTSTVSQQTGYSISRFPITKTLLWNVKVLYIGLKIEEVTQPGTATTGAATTQAQSSITKEKITTVTLAVPPEDAEKLVFSEEIGRVWLALLPTQGIPKKDTVGRTLENIFN